MPSASIIIPVYHTEKYLPRCLDSVLAQTHPDFEVICVNDGSTDSCVDILDAYAQKSNKIRIITQENQGTSAARNNGLNAATGNYVFFLDSDDYIHPQLLEITLDYASRYDADMVSFRPAQSNIEALSMAPIAPNSLPFKVTDNPIFLGVGREKFHLLFGQYKLYRRSFLSGISFIPNLNYEDVHHTYAVLAKRPRTVSLLYKLYGYNIIEGSRSHPKEAMLSQITDHHAIVSQVCKIYEQEHLKAERLFLRKNFIPTILNEQYKICKRASATMQQQMHKALAKELHELHQMGMLHWRGHKFLRYWKYRQLMKQHPSA